MITRVLTPRQRHFVLPVVREVAPGRPPTPPAPPDDSRWTASQRNLVAASVLMYPGGGR